MIIDLRSDTVTKPSKEMLAQMLAANVGDDVIDIDPTTSLLENHAAEMFGKEAGLFCPSGTMTNQIAIRLHTNIGAEVICDKLSHIYHYEGGGIAVNSAASVRLLDGDRGRFTAEQVEEAINPNDIHFPNSSMVSLEDTCNKGGGVFYELNQIKEINKVAKANGLAVHLDGARLFNGLVESGYNYKEYGNQFDTISICLSKGLGAPVGSLLLGTEKQILAAKRVRKVLGGGMRQSGYMAAAGIYALENNISRLTEDHKRAKTLAQELQYLPGVIQVRKPETNIVILETESKEVNQKLIAKLAQKDIKVVAFGPTKIRLVTHLDFTDKMLDRLVDVVKTF